MNFGTIQDFEVLLGTTAWQKIGSQAVAGKVRSFALRAANIGTQDHYANVRLTNGAKTGRRAINFPVRYQSSESAPDLERVFLVPAGYWLEVMASANNAIEFTLTTVEDDA